MNVKKKYQRPFLFVQMPDPYDMLYASSPVVNNNDFGTDNTFGEWN